MKVKDLRLYLEPWPEDYEVRAHVLDWTVEQSYHSALLFVGLAPYQVGVKRVVFIEVDSDREFD